MDIVGLCSSVLQWHCSANSNVTGPLKTSFHSSRLPPISITDYLARIYRYSKCSEECLVLALVFMDRFLAATATPLSQYNVHRMVLVSVMIAAKTHDDIYFSNGYFGSIGGISREEINKLEITFLTTCKWQMWVEHEEYEQYLAQAVLKVKSVPPGSAVPPI